MTVRTYIAKRMLQIFPVLLGVVVINFVIIHMAPGNPAVIMAGGEAPPEYIKMLEEEWGLNKPLYEQFVTYLGNLLRGNLGYSYKYRAPVLDVILERLPATLLLTGTAFLIAVLAGVILGVSSSKKPFSFEDNTIMLGSLVFYSMPNFWTGLMAIMIFSLRLGLFPVQGMQFFRADLNSTLDLIWHLVLPATTLGLVQLALYARLTRSSMLEELRKDYITTARSKGLDDRSILYRHALKNALIPTITIIGIRLSFMFTGAVVTETIFAWPGIGRLMYDSIYTRDYPLLMGIFIISSAVTVLANFLADIAYCVVDPRIRYE
jgi:peptide/nickel transport system permease protein